MAVLVLRFKEGDGCARYSTYVVKGGARFVEGKGEREEAVMANNNQNIIE